MSIQKFLDLSTGHLPAEDRNLLETIADKLPVRVARHAYGWIVWLTGDKRFIDEGIKRLNSAMGSQRRNQGPIWDGMIYQKAYYSRPSEFLYSIPWIFEAMKE